MFESPEKGKRATLNSNLVQQILTYSTRPGLLFFDQARRADWRTGRAKKCALDDKLRVIRRPSEIKGRVTRGFAIAATIVVAPKLRRMQSQAADTNVRVPDISECRHVPALIDADCRRVAIIENFDSEIDRSEASGSAVDPP
jgi:hypothetical protein